VAAYQAKGAADLAASKLNLVNSSLYALSAPTADPTFDTSYGWSFTSATKNYLVPADLKPNANATWSMVIRFSDWSVGGIIGCINTSYFNFFISKGVLSGHGSWAGRVTNAPHLTTGVYGLAGQNAYRNGVIETNNPSGTSTTSNWLMAIGGLLMYGSYNSCSTSKVQACAFYNATLTATQMANLVTAMNAL
jgi:hypothetical protein